MSTDDLKVTNIKQNSSDLLRVLLINGPTASGKSAMAMDIAEHFNGTVINADSQQVYRELRIVTARPTIEDEKRVPHRLFGIMGGDTPCSAADWVKLACIEINTAHNSGRLPIIVGGTGLYLKSLTEGLSPIPDIPPSVRERGMARQKELGAEAFHDEVASLDPAAGDRLPPGDRQRLLRAWEVTTHTGRPFSQWRDEPRIKPLPDATFATISVIPPRDVLYAGIDARFLRMVNEGALAEIEALAELGLDPTLPLMKGLGVPELLAFVAGEMSLGDAVEQAQKLSRNYAKRQLTWGRNQIQGAFEVPAQYSESLRPKIFSFIHEFLLTGEA